MSDESTMVLPGRRRIAAVMRAASRRFVQELNAPSEQAPAWSAFEWRAAMAVASMHGIAALLGQRLRWRGPEAWEAFLAEQQAHGLLREARVRELLGRLDEAARGAGLALMALKGSALLELKLYAPGTRPQSDVDLLCRPEDEAAAIALIESLGYVAGNVSWKHREFRPRSGPTQPAFGEHVANPHKIELHVRISERLPYRLAVLDLQAPADRGPGLHFYAGRHELLRHLLLHAAGNLCGQAGRLVHLHDIAVLCRALDPAEQARLFDPVAAGWAWPPLALAERGFPGSVPPVVLERAAAAASPVLRRWVAAQSIEELSLIDPCVKGFGGLAWAEDLGSAVQYGFRKFVPEPGMPRPTADGMPWLAPERWQRWRALPRWLRIVRWGIAPPPRPEVMYSLHMACAYRPAAAEQRR